jgi:hypothetical protein
MLLAACRARSLTAGGSASLVAGIGALIVPNFVQDEPERPFVSERLLTRRDLPTVACGRMPDARGPRQTDAATAPARDAAVQTDDELPDVAANMLEDRQGIAERQRLVKDLMSEDVDLRWQY